jgi:hypothetical protein
MAEEQITRPSPFSRPPTAPPPVVSAVTPRTSAAAPVAAQPHMTILVDEQNLPMGFMAGLAAAAGGAAIWSMITLVTNFQIGWMAVGVGFLVGWAVRVAGKGTTTMFGVLGAALALGGCLAGNLLTVCVVASRQFEVGVLDVVARLTPGFTLDLMWAMFSPIDVLFYGLAIYEGYRFSIAGAGTEG